MAFRLVPFDRPLDLQPMFDAPATLAQAQWITHDYVALWFDALGDLAPDPVAWRTADCPRITLDALATRLPGVDDDTFRLEYARGYAAMCRAGESFFAVGGVGDAPALRVVIARSLFVGASRTLQNAVRFDESDARDMSTRLHGVAQALVASFGLPHTEGQAVDCGGRFHTVERERGMPGLGALVTQALVLVQEIAVLLVLASAPVSVDALQRGSSGQRDDATRMARRVVKDRTTDMRAAIREEIECALARSAAVVRSAAAPSLRA